MCRINIWIKSQEVPHVMLKSHFYFSGSWELYETITKIQCLKFYILEIRWKTAESRIWYSHQIRNLQYTCTIMFRAVELKSLSSSKVSILTFDQFCFMKSQSSLLFFQHRLRHEKTKIKEIDRGGPSDYQMLKWSPIQEPPSIPKPKSMKKNKDDSFDITLEI